MALSVSTVTRPDTDSLILQFAKKGAYPVIARTGPAEISLTFPPGTLEGEKKPEEVDFKSSRLIEDVRLSGDTVLVRLKTDAFGFVGWPEGEGGVKVQVYRDPAGARWTPPQGEANTTWPPAEESNKVGSALTLPVTPPNNKPGPLELPPLPPALSAPPAPGVRASVQPSAAAGSEAQGPREPFYAMPNSLRATALRVDADKAPVLRPGGLAPSLPPQAEVVPSQGGGGPVGMSPSGAGEYRVKLPPIPRTLAAQSPKGVPATPAGAMPVTPPTDATAVTPPPAMPPKADAHAAADKTGTAEHGKDAKEGQGAIQPVDDENHDANMLVAAEAEKLAGNYDVAKNMLSDLLAKSDLAPEVREEAAHALASNYVDMYKDDPGPHYDEILGALQRAINVNPNSFRVPEALLHLGMLNLRVGNLPEAKGYFNVLTKKYPTDVNVPLVNFYWGEYYFDRGDYKKAAEEYQTVVEKFPESKYVREGAMGLAKTLVRTGRYKEAAQIADYIDKRWPRYYIEFPQILRIDGDIAYRNGDYQKARDDYMMFYNIMPKVKDADLVLAKLGDIYAKLGKRGAAVDFYNMAVKDYPDEEGGLIAKMRLAEQGVHDQPNISEMFSLFGKPRYGSPEEIYRSIIRDHPKSPLAPLAQIKLAMWLLYNQNYPESLKAAARFLERYPKNELAPKAENVAITSFEKMAGDLIAHKDYATLTETYLSNPILPANRGLLSDRTRLGLALAFFRTGKTKEALTEALPFIGPQESDNGNMALVMALTIYQNEQAWRDIVQLARKVQNWRFGPSQRRDIEFTVATALDNLGESSRALPLWRKLAGDQSLESEKRCYAMYFMAKHSMDNKELEKAALYANEAAFMFQETGRDPDKLRASLNILVEATKGLGQNEKALEWARQYAAQCTKGSDEWAANELRIASLQSALGDMDGWRKTLTGMRDAAPDSLYGRMAASDLAASGLQQRLDALNGSQ